MQRSESLGDRFSLDGKTALITGGSSGLGAHFARVLSEAGCRVALCARRLDALEDLATELCKSGAKAIAYEMDVTDLNSVERAVAAVESEFSSIDILVNNAGIANTQKFLEMSEQAWQDVIDVNLSAVWRVGQRVAASMVRQACSGRIINIASVLGIAAQSRQANYCASKAGVIQLTRSMALELGRKGILVNAIAPGYFITEINREFFQTDRGRQYLSGLFPGRAGRLEELDGVLLLLASEAGSYINGSVFTVDGGALLGNM
ncbi:MAG: SDR family NAD(P)-dependent oxidoreductase [Pseudomonadota bacterium]